MFNFIKIISEVLILLVPILFALPSDSFIYKYEFVSTNIATIRMILIGILFFAIFVRYAMEYRNFKLKKENVKLREAVKSYRSFISAVINEKLREVSDNLNLNEDDRVTVFLYSSSLDKFFSAGRYSSASIFNDVGRYIIEDKDEYVYRVLNDRRHHTSAPEIKNGLIKKRKMQSKSMFGVPLWDDQHMNKIGVVIYQCIRTDAYKSKEIRTKHIDEIKVINELINEMRIDPNSISSVNDTLRGF